MRYTFKSTQIDDFLGKIRELESQETDSDTEFYSLMLPTGEMMIFVGESVDDVYLEALARSRC